MTRSSLGFSESLRRSWKLFAELGATKGHIKEMANGPCSRNNNSCFKPLSKMKMLPLAGLVLSVAFLSLKPSAASSVEQRARAQVVTHCTVPNTVALTFDDGPYIYLYHIVDVLEAAGAKGTFFFNGNNYDCIYDTDPANRVKYAYDRGHQVASHTWAHKDLTTLTWDKVHNEMWRVEEALVKITGAYPAFMRPPYGKYNDMVLDVSGIRGQTVTIWDFDSQDSLGASPQTSKNLYDQTIGRRPTTILALNHEVIETTAHQVVHYAVRRLQSAGYKLVTLAECLGKAPYQSVVPPETRDSSWHC